MGEVIQPAFGDVSFELAIPSRDIELANQARNTAKSSSESLRMAFSISLIVFITAL